MDASRKCVVKGCFARTGVTFYQFPNRTRLPTLRKYWIEAVRLSNEASPRWSPKKHHRICSNHFVDTEPIPDHNYIRDHYNVPTIFPSSQSSSNRETAHQDDAGEEDLTRLCAGAESENEFDEGEMPENRHDEGERPENEVHFLDEFMVPKEDEYIIEEPTKAMISLEEQPEAVEDNSRRKERVKMTVWGSKKETSSLSEQEISVIPKKEEMHQYNSLESKEAAIKCSIRVVSEAGKRASFIDKAGSRDSFTRKISQGKLKKIPAKSKPVTKKRRLKKSNLTYRKSARRKKRSNKPEKARAIKTEMGTSRSNKTKKETEDKTEMGTRRIKIEKDSVPQRELDKVQFKRENGLIKPQMPSIVIRCDSCDSSSSPLIDVKDDDDSEVDPIDLRDGSGSDSGKDSKSYRQRLRTRAQLPSKRSTEPKDEDEMSRKRWKRSGVDQSTQVALPGKCDGFVFCIVRDDDFTVGTQGNIFYNFKLPLKFLNNISDPAETVRKDKAKPNTKA